MIIAGPATFGHLIDVLRSILVELETTSGLPSDHPDLLDLKDIVLSRIAQLEFAKAEQTKLPTYRRVA